MVVLSNRKIVEYKHNDLYASFAIMMPWYFESESILLHYLLYLISSMLHMSAHKSRKIYFLCHTKTFENRNFPSFNRKLDISSF